MTKFEWAEFDEAQTVMEDCMAAADMDDLRKIITHLDALKATVHDHILSAAGADGDH